MDASGYIHAITNPANETYHMVCAAGGLLQAFTDPRGHTPHMTYDALGRLIRDENAAGGFGDLPRTEETSAYEITLASAEGRTITYRVEKNPATGEERLLNTYPDATPQETLAATNGTRTVTRADGTVVVPKNGPDPRFGMAAPVTEGLTLAGVDRQPPR